MKVAVLGGGGFRTPHVWESVAEVKEAGVEELVLQDPSGSRLARIAAVIEGLRRESGGGTSLRTTTSLIEAVEGADMVFCALRVGGLEGRVIDETVPLGAGVLGQETVGPGGICFALRTVPVMVEIARVVAEHAPSSWFLNFTNPAGLVTEAVQEVLGDRAVGICDSPAALCARVAAALGRRMTDLSFDYAGLNHLGWLLAVRDGERDLLPALLADDRLLARVEEARLFGPERLRRHGLIPNEYLVYLESPEAVVAALGRAGAARAETLLAQQTDFYGAGNEPPEQALASWRAARAARYDTYMAEAWGTLGSEPAAPLADPRADEGPGETPEPRTHGHGVGTERTDEGPGEAGYALVAATFLRALGRAAGETLILNVANRGRLPFLDDRAVVEVPCTVGPTGLRPHAVGALPPPEADLVARVKDVERTTIRAALEGSRDLALQALTAHPVVPSSEHAERILGGYLASFPDLAERLR
ncbi:MAG: 6-phospho-beta-glucosidase [Actinomycetota bacterium]